MSEISNFHVSHMRSFTCTTLFFKVTKCTLFHSITKREKQFLLLHFIQKIHQSYKVTQRRLSKLNLNCQ